MADNWKLGMSEIAAVLSLAGSILVGGYVMGVGLQGVEGKVDALSENVSGKIQTLTVKVNANAKNIEDVEYRVKGDQDKIIKQLDSQAQTMETIRVESKEERRLLLEELREIRKSVQH